MKRFLQICLLVLCAGGAAVAATPSTQVTVSRPTTKTAVTRPTTAVQVSRPKTDTPVSRPQTQVNISRPETRVTVSHPTTAVSVSRPSTTQAGQPTAVAGGKLSSGAKSGKTVTSSVSATTSMSGYQPPKAKDFQAAQLGGGDSGLGNKVNEAEKDAAAKNSLAPKALSATAENVMSSANKNVDKGTLSDLVKRETSKHK
ncbi:MAG: hypothetical protein PUK74_00260 [Elusimicrobia bacterium]|nr:hypothetical protein [Elusimicrobiota bacterium]MDY5728878.1 hypothetical protein [Elusimicrobiaceae bacterium]